MFCTFVVLENKGEAFCVRCFKHAKHKVGRKIVSRCRVVNDNFGTSGTHLHRLLSAFGFDATSQCKCTARVARMNEMGNDWCEENIETIVGWLKEEASNRGLPFLNAVGRMLVRRAIANARREAERAKDPSH